MCFFNFILVPFISLNVNVFVMLIMALLYCNNSSIYLFICLFVCLFVCFFVLFSVMNYMYLFMLLRAPPVTITSSRAGVSQRS